LASFGWLPFSFFKIGSSPKKRNISPSVGAGPDGHTLLLFLPALFSQHLNDAGPEVIVPSIGVLQDLP
jgi:hypothetical protein